MSYTAIKLFLEHVTVNARINASFSDYYPHHRRGAGW